MLVKLLPENDGVKDSPPQFDGPASHSVLREGGACAGPRDPNLTAMIRFTLPKARTDPCGFAFDGRVV